MKLQHFIGIDVSKSDFHYSVYFSGQIVEQGNCINSEKGIIDLLSVLRRLPDFELSRSLFCMEHTGIYCTHLLTVLADLDALICVELAARIKSSLGFQRGKSDEIDARRIAEYAYRFCENLTLWKPKRKAIIQLQHLSTTRDRLVKVKSQMEVPLHESKSFLDEQSYELIEKHSIEVIKVVKDKIEELESQIENIIQSDEHLKLMVKRIRSIPGIGPVIATELIIRTNEFKDIKNAKALACHAGVAPFEHSSGSSIRGKSRVSHKAHKRLKKMLHLGALTAIRQPGELKDFYNRKVQEGKNKMSVINAVRNKLIHRAYAVVRDNTMYHKNYNTNLRMT